MEEKEYDEFYAVMDEINARIEEIVNEHDDPEIRDVVVSKLHEKASEFLYSFEEEIEKLEMIEMVV